MALVSVGVEDIDRPRPALPSFARPPVAEVALTIYFLPALGLAVPHLGKLRTMVKERLPLFEQHPPLPPQQPEVLGQVPFNPFTSLQISDLARTPRCWFISDNLEWIMQVQDDRVVINWRRVPDGSEYPRYAAVRSAFKREIESFWEFLEGNGLDIPKRLMGEIVYVNTIKAGNSWQKHADVASVFSVDLGYSLVPDLTIEDARWSNRFVFHSGAGDPTGRLYTYIEPVVTFPEAQAAYNFNLVARGGEAHGIDEILNLLDEGRRVIVTAFAAMTTEKMHREWGRDDSLSG